MQNLPLVTVIVVTYNSSSFILETLESVSDQTWDNIELIISDDCSTDDTVKMCYNWLETNKKRFTTVEIITSGENTGVSANANRGLKVSKGDWVKFLGADDTLKPQCLEDNMLWIFMHPEARVLFSRIEVYRDTFETQNLLYTIPGDPFDPNSITAPGKSAESQYRLLLLSDRIHFSPSVFLHRETVISIGGFDERYKLLEDYPLWLNLTRTGHKLCFMDKVTVNYRRHSKAINNTVKSYVVNPNYFKSEEFRTEYTYPFLPTDIRLNQRFVWYVSQIFRIKLINNNKRVFKVLNTTLTIWLNPFRYFIWLRKYLNKDLKQNDFYI